jgi:hypothetical protein
MERGGRLLEAMQAGVGDRFVENGLRHLEAGTQPREVLADLPALFKNLAEAAELQQTVAGQQLDQNRIAIPAVAVEGIARPVQKRQRLIVPPEYEVGEAENLLRARDLDPLPGGDQHLL